MSKAKYPDALYAVELNAEVDWYALFSLLLKKRACPDVIKRLMSRLPQYPTVADFYARGVVTRTDVAWLIDALPHIERVIAASNIPLFGRIPTMRQINAYAVLKRMKVLYEA